MDGPINCSMDTPDGVSMAATCHLSRNNDRIFNGRDHGTPHDHSAHPGKNHDIMAYNITFHDVNHGVARGMENPMGVPRGVYHSAIHADLTICAFHGESHGLTLILILAIGHAVVCSKVKPWHRRWVSPCGEP